MVKVGWREAAVGWFEGERDEGKPEFRNVQDFKGDTPKQSAYKAIRDEISRTRVPPPAIIPHRRVDRDRIHRQLLKWFQTVV
jgi:hypothetical protein